MAEALLTLDGISVAYGGLVAVDAVSLAVGVGEVVGLVGPNGAGKTTLFNAVSGLVRPSGGRATFAGRDLLSLSIHARARAGLGRAFQVPQPMHQLTVRENLLVAQRFGTGRIDHGRIGHLLELLDLTPKAEAEAATALALTEQKALEVGKALATEPRLLMLDEVLAGLETAGKRLFMQRLERVRAEFGLAMLVIEHDIETITRLCRRVLVLDFGRPIAEGPPAQVFADPEVIRSYTGGDARA